MNTNHYDIEHSDTKDLNQYNIEHSDTKDLRFHDAKHCNTRSHNNTEYYKVNKNEDKMSAELSWDPLLLWVNPLQCCLNVISLYLHQERLQGLASIGCGSGLLEWLIHKVSGK